jgi:hypothetical protein
MNVRTLVIALSALAGCDRAPPAPPATKPSASVAPAKSVASAAPASASANAVACIVVGVGAISPEVTLEGKIETGKHSHPNGTSFDFYTLKLAKPRCAVGLEDATSVDEVQLMSSDEVKALVGKQVRVAGTPMAGMTAWHVRPVVLTEETISPL